MTNNRRTYRFGFTLIELMVVILIVAILAASAIARYRGRVDAVRWSEGKVMLGTIATALRAYAGEKGWNGANPTDIFGSGQTELGFEPGDLTGRYFADGDFQIDAVNINAQPVTFTIRCTAGTGIEPPTIPSGYTLDQSGHFAAIP
ncbi:MAG: prepilin-type N-terminal cleavage/methylation domain-containing protein [Sedimentisphaerales bacterium]|nr:prepilin-type N-terminal cleavage/methylation domain-containing protein [Sedimentisphaerales bacterium]